MPIHGIWTQQSTVKGIGGAASGGGFCYIVGVSSFSFFSSDSPTDLVFTVAMVDTDGKPAGAAVEVRASGVGSKRAGEVAVQLDEVSDPTGGDFAAFFGVHFLQEARLSDKRRHPGAFDKKNNFGFLAILLSYFKCSTVS